MRIGILGAGLSGISLAYFAEQCARVARIELLEKAAVPGGLARSFPFGNLCYDLGPHILFSKNAAVLDLMVEMLGGNVQKLRRSNKILHDGRWVKYPFENDLAALSEEDKQYCLDRFLNNPYRQYAPQNMLQFFLATFGEGITNLYLRPYNEKIWKFDPAFLDTQMVERIPRPPDEDIVRSAAGVASEGYVHQLYFYYPKTGGIASLIRAMLERLGPKVGVRLNAEVQRVERRGSAWRVHTADGAQREYERLVSTIPIPALIDALGRSVPEEVAEAARALKSNSIAVCAIRVSGDVLGENFAITIADNRVLFHRLTKLNVLFPPETGDGTTSLLAEVTYRKGDPIDALSDGQITDRVVADLASLGLIPGRAAVLASDLVRSEYAYIIYDLDHRRNTAVVRDWCRQLGVLLHGRFGEFEYLNMDAVIERSLEKRAQIEALA